MPSAGDSASRTRRIEPRDIELFTELTGDRNPLHYDADAAAGTRFGGIIVQGGVTSGLLNAVVAEDLPGPGSVFLHVDWRFTAPVRPGDTITARVEVLEVREDKPITKLRTTVERDDGTVALEGTALVWTEPLASATETGRPAQRHPGVSARTAPAVYDRRVTTERPTIGFVHTVLTLPATFSALAQELVPGSDVFHIADESLLGVTRRTGTLSPTTKRRVLGHILSAADAGADAVVVTCSSIGPAVDEARGFVPVPVVRIDEAMADEAVRTGSRIGVLATLRTTLEPTAALVERRASEAGTRVEVLARLADGAFDALSAGELERHDELVREALRELSRASDVVVLAQASMARVAETLSDDERTVPILASPRLGMQRVAELVAQLPKR